MSKASIQLSDHFTCGRLIRFTLPSITMMIFTRFTAWWTAFLCPITRERRPLRR